MKNLEFARIFSKKRFASVWRCSIVSRLPQLFSWRKRLNRILIWPLAALPKHLNKHVMKYKGTETEGMIAIVVCSQIVESFRMRIYYDRIRTDISQGPNISEYNIEIWDIITFSKLMSKKATRHSAAKYHSLLSTLYVMAENFFSFHYLRFSFRYNFIFCIVVVLFYLWWCWIHIFHLISIHPCWTRSNFHLSYNIIWPFGIWCFECYISAFLHLILTNRRLEMWQKSRG